MERYGNMKKERKIRVQRKKKSTEVMTWQANAASHRENDKEHPIVGMMKRPFVGLI